MAWDERQFKLEGSRHVLDSRQARVRRRTLQVRYLSLSQAQLAGQLLLAELFAPACFAEQISYCDRNITDTWLLVRFITCE